VLTLAKVFYLLGDYPASRTQLASLQLILPASLQARYFEASGWVFLREERHDAALGEFNTWLNLEPLDPEGLNALGWAVYYSGDCAAAKGYFEEALQYHEGEWAHGLDSFADANENPRSGLELSCD
jgi:tetratricopeptide (TPR) repeat protein